MEKIKLSKNEKRVFLFLLNDGDKPLAYFDDYNWTACCRTLERYGFAKVQYLESGYVCKATITYIGKEYYAANPGLKNPINWSLVAAVASVAASVIAFLALFSCISNLT